MKNDLCAGRGEQSGGSEEADRADGATPLSRLGGLAGWLFRKAAGVPRTRKNLSLVERIALSPHHSLALVDVAGKKILVATSNEGSPAFYPLESLHVAGDGARSRTRTQTDRAMRISW